MREALRVLDRGGRLVINAIRKSTPIPQLDYAEHLWFEKEVKSVANVTRRDALEFLPLAAQIPIVPQVKEFRLEQANDFVKAIKDFRCRRLENPPVKRIISAADNSIEASVFPVELLSCGYIIQSKLLN